MNQLQALAPEIIKLCKGHKVKSLYAFGSVLTDKFNDESDIDWSQKRDLNPAL